jgi:hypothetical protein
MIQWRVRQADGPHVHLTLFCGRPHRKLQDLIRVVLDSARQFFHQFHNGLKTLSGLCGHKQTEAEVAGIA